MLGISEDIKDLRVSIDPSGRRIDVFINGQKVDRGELKVQEITFNFSKNESEYITVKCTKTEAEQAYSEEKRDRAARAGVEAAKLDERMNEKSKSYGINVSDVFMVILFDDETDFRDALEVNPHLRPLMGIDEYGKEQFPGVFMAGVVEMLDSGEHRHEATQKQYASEERFHQESIS